MKKHINADFLKLLIAFLIICASFKPGLADAATINTEASVNRASYTLFTLPTANSIAPLALPSFHL